ncbi:MAG: 50S ribosomal protein P1 [Euryarchaeota archaeon]|nr:50S ribosomal protein P1 [Euryarchaeota archaeon]MDE1835947.1 50S ribosomal protein P1 [Euryarchaeota archaeon]MDE1880619.1 50S ribosomal protein P1 [Euryarchaeota archaeon]MDE2044375.1 50S ribosomal protein P1 [Thermoplasmata archaeon]
MQYVYGAMLLHAAGKPIDEKGINGVLTAAGVQSDAARVKALVASLEGVNIKDVLAKAETMAVAAPAAAAPAAHAGGEKKEEKKKEEEKPAVSEEEASAGLSALFG